MKRDTTSGDFFESKYRIHSDPWQFASSEYEASRYGVTFNALKHRRYRRAFEPGCSIGILTRKLATICDSLDACDISPTAVTQAQERCRDLPNVRIVQAELPHNLPLGEFDLVVLSEIAYYFEERQVVELGEELVRRLVKPGVLLAVHWLGTSSDHALPGDRVHELLGGLQGLSHAHGERHSGFRLDRWDRS